MEDEWYVREYTLEFIRRTAPNRRPLNDCVVLGSRFCSIRFQNSMLEFRSMFNAISRLPHSFRTTFTVDPMTSALANVLVVRRFHYSSRGLLFAPIRLWNRSENETRENHNRTSIQRWWWWFR